MFKKLAALVMAVLMLCTVASVFTSCAGGAASDLKIGCIMVGDETEGYTKAHMDGIKEAAKALGIADNQIIWKYRIEETSACLDAAQDLVGQGCTLVISNSYGHQTYMVQAAEQFPDVTFVSMTGDFAAISGVKNLKNGFTKVFESRYVSGVVGGMKLAELVADGKVSPTATPDSYDADGNIKINLTMRISVSMVISYGENNAMGDTVMVGPGSYYACSMDINLPKDNLDALADADWSQYDYKTTNDFVGTMEARVQTIPEQYRFKGTVNLAYHLHLNEQAPHAANH